MKNLIRKLFGRPAELPVLSVTVPAPAGPARIATPAEQRIAEAAIVLANARQREALADAEAHNAYLARIGAQTELTKAMREVGQS